MTLCVYVAVHKCVKIYWHPYTHIQTEDKLGTDTFLRLLSFKGPSLIVIVRIHVFPKSDHRPNPKLSNSMYLEELPGTQTKHDRIKERSMTDINVHLTDFLVLPSQKPLQN